MRAPSASPGRRRGRVPPGLPRGGPRRLGVGDRRRSGRASRPRSSTGWPRRARAAMHARSSAPPAWCARCGLAPRTSCASGSSPPLLETDYDRAQRGAQFLTERHGGSDVGANRVEAVPDGDAWRLHGEKWFCSVADADQFLVTARPRGAPDGTPRHRLLPRAALGGRLPDPQAEGQARHAGARDRRDRVRGRVRRSRSGRSRRASGRRSSVLNTSRWLNAVGSAGLMRRAYDEASAFAREREAFGGPIERFPLVRENLAVMKAEAAAALASYRAPDRAGRADRRRHRDRATTSPGTACS